MLFVLYPILQSVLISLTNWGGLTADKHFIGIANFQKMLGDGHFWNALEHNFILIIVVPASIQALALVFAALIAGGIRGGRIYRIAYFLPQVMSIAVIATLWSFVYHPTIGILNAGFGVLHLEGLQQTWLGDPATALGSVAAVYVWADVGLYTVFFVTGIRAIPYTYYEAAHVEGASRTQEFRHITIPLLWGVIRTSLVYEMIAVMGVFAIVLLMTAGGPDRSTDVVGTYVYEQGFVNGEYGYAAALATSVMAITIILAVAAFAATKREAVQY
jgi:N-acetylglucosamine transport system permease protein